jgi:predicted glycoside hydrolase/deacetylase ChbG (UPF0249 family)
MLIVNADDYGRNRQATDRIAECRTRCRVSAASAMVFMADSERAARLACDAGHRLGLHLNFSESFTGQGLSPSIRRDHERIRRFVLGNKYALVLFHPGLTGAFTRVFSAQLEEFVRLYGEAPTHFDGHQHYHLATNILVQQLLPPRTVVRRSFSFREGEKGALNLWYRRAVDATLARRHALTDFFFSAAPHLSTDSMMRIVLLANEADVELMVHPELDREHEWLLSGEFGALLARVNVGGHETQ